MLVCSIANMKNLNSQQHGYHKKNTKIRMTFCIFSLPNFSDVRSSNKKLHFSKYFISHKLSKSPSFYISGAEIHVLGKIENVSQIYWNMSSHRFQFISYICLRYHNQTYFMQTLLLRKILSKIVSG